MGRSKQQPKKRQHCEDHFNFYDYFPVKKRKFNKVNSQKYFSVIPSNDTNKQFNLGTITLGITDNDFPNEYHQCRICFKKSEDEENTNSFILECDGGYIVIVKASVDLHFLKDIVLSKVFALDFWAKENEIFVDIYLYAIPLEIFTTKIGKLISSVFKVLLGIETNTAISSCSGNSPSQYKKYAHGEAEIMKLYEKLFLLRENKLNICDVNVQHSFLKPILRPYQIKAVQWMIHQENANKIANGELHPLYVPVIIKSGITLYYDRFNGYVVLEKPLIDNVIKGGILADEMGLGKTVEVLACILANSNLQENSRNSESTPTIHIPKRKSIPLHTEKVTQLDNYSEKKSKVPKQFVKKSKSATYLALERVYMEALFKTSTVCRATVNEKQTPTIQCICGSSYDKDLVTCDSCKKIQHNSCLGFEGKSLDLYYCPQCWLKKPLIDCCGTLIVTPVTLKTQWCKEIRKHIKGDLKVLVYEGYGSSPIYPTSLKEYDIVITTYQVLQNELRLTEELHTVKFRNKRKYSPPGCPLVRIKWKRLCLDEAQTVDAPGKMVSEMASKIIACYRWAITGTPISKNISDLFGLMSYLQIAPFNDYSTWKHILYDPYVNGNDQPMIEILLHVFWRTAKKNIMDQINIPKQTFKEHILEFSAVEKYFYKREHEMSSSDFLSRVNKYSPSLLLQNLDRSASKKILAPLSSLRHTCTHPNTTGKYLATKKRVSSMKDLLEALILKNCCDSEEALRLIASSLNGLAGIHILLKDPQQAIHFYREVLQLSARFSREKSQGKIAVDKLLVIHAMHNLAEILDTHTPEQPTLRDETLRSDCSTLEKEYMDKFITQTSSSYESFCNVLKEFCTLQSKFILSEGQWYSDGLDWIFINNYYEHLLEKIQTASDIANVKCNLRFESQRTLLKNIYLWFNEVMDLRNKLFEAVKQLYEESVSHNNKILIKDTIVQRATFCHLRPNKKVKATKKCPVCISNDRLKAYECKLFNMVQRSKHFEEMSLQGSWKPTLEELIFKSLLTVLKSKSPNSPYISDGEVHVQIIDTSKKEFKELRKFWTFLDQQICAQDELDICKIRLQLKEATTSNKANSIHSERVIKHLSYTIENKFETLNLLSVHDLDYQDSFLRNEMNINMNNLNKLLGTQNYLDTLRKQQYEGQSPDPCPICKNPLEQHWSILLCGHSYCLDCIHVFLEKNSGKYIECSICRSKQKIQDISYIKAGNFATQEESKKIKGNFSTKIEAIIDLLLKLISEDPKVKILLFSFWVSILKCLKDALTINDIKNNLFLNYSMESRIEDFKNANKGITVLLLPISLGSKGLNLIEATHVILVEPLLNPADELQAIGRIHRIGQTKPTFIHKFVIKDTIEESIHQATTTNAENWDKTKVTLQNLIHLFNDNEDVCNTSQCLENVAQITELSNTTNENNGEAQNDLNNLEYIPQISEVNPPERGCGFETTDEALQPDIESPLEESTIFVESYVPQSTEIKCNSITGEVNSEVTNFENGIMQTVNNISEPSNVSYR